MEIRHAPTRMDGSLDRSALRCVSFRMDPIGAENAVFLFPVEGDVGERDMIVSKERNLCMYTM